MRSGLVVAVIVVAGSAAAEPITEPIAHGRGKCGKLEGGVALPCSGEGFTAFSSLACAMGRNYLHPLVVETVVVERVVVERANPLSRELLGQLPPKPFQGDV